MSGRDLLLLYAAIGIACAIAVLRKAAVRDASTIASAVVTVPLWPLWAPFALATRDGPRRAAPSYASPEGDRAEGGPLGRIDRALAEAVDAVAGTPMSDAFSKATAARIEAEVRRVASRLEELRALEARTARDAVASARRLQDLAAQGAPERAVATARLRHESLSRLEALRAADAQALEELADLLEALRTQLLLARYAGSSAEGADAIVTEVWARLEGLGTAFDMGPA
jgi:hypothetical protein